MKYALAATALIFSCAAAAQSPTQSELDDYYAKDAAARAAQQIVVRGFEASIEEIIALLKSYDGRFVALDNKAEAALARLAALEGKVDTALATLKILQAQPGVTTQQVIDSLIAKLTAP
jgi:hypothetical protein